jgi:hypothetical protein
MPARYTIEVDGVTYHVMASGRAKACETAVRTHTGYDGKIITTFARFVPSGVIYLATTAHNVVYEVVVRQ